MDKNILKQANIIRFTNRMQYIRNRVYMLDSVSSTNEILLALDEIESGTVIRAKTQTSGKGRQGRNWHSDDGGLWFSVGFNLDKLSQTEYLAEIDAHKIIGINLASALAVVRAIIQVGVKNAKIKWPNDVYLNERKICGILTQSRFEGRNCRIVVGIGLNVNQKTSVFPEEISEKAGSLASITSTNYSIEKILGLILIELDKLIFDILISGSIAGVCKEINRYSMLNGREVKLQHGANVYSGIVQSIANDGALHLLTNTKSAFNHKISSGDILEDSSMNNVLKFYAGEISDFSFPPF
ncbi:MAG: biotin--[acetyl-CoA-carboxylase] ligase [Planctomycetes bacterium]|nr:biotin--[acetyl-CoA-carboxylase] ligase [Planctomycetota bacterium]